MKMEYSNKRIMVVTAHPDDETFGMGGTIALYCRKGAEVSLICATKGEAGEADQQLLSHFESMKDLRVSELRCAMEILGIKALHFLNYRDSGMPGADDNDHPLSLMQAPIEDVSKKIERLMEGFKPNIVITFDQSGGYGHPDHIKINRATILALNNCLSNQERKRENINYPEKLIFHTMSGGFLSLAVILMPLFGMNPKKFGKNEDIDLTKLLGDKSPVHVRINCKSVTNIRNQASACYRSQGGDRQSGFFLNWLQRLFSNTESFIQYYPTKISKRIKKDLFS